MSHCDDCGERMYGGICTNCHEELYIEVNQGDEMLDVPRSDEWLAKVEEQRRQVLARPHKQIVRRAIAEERAESSSGDDLRERVAPKS